MESCVLRSNAGRKAAITVTYLLLGGLLILLSQVGKVHSGPTRTTANRNESSTHVTNPKQQSEIEHLNIISKSGKLLGNSGTRNPKKRSGGTWRNGTVCIPTRDQRGTFKIGLKVENLKILENCSIIEGNLVIKWMIKDVSETNYTAVHFPQLVEITGYLLIYRVNGLSTLGKLFPNLRVIRGNEVFWAYALALYENEDMTSVSLPKLSYIGRNIAAMVNPQLCYFEDHVDWKRVISTGEKPISISNRVSENGCNLVDGCPSNCSSACWDMDHCQEECSCIKSADDNHIPGCADNRGPCCDEQCLGGCAKPGSPSECYACKNVYYKDKCLERCPDEDDNGEPLLEFNGRRCLTRAACIKENVYNKFHDGKCVLLCPKYWTHHPGLSEDPVPMNYTVHVCTKCDGICDKVCQGGTIQTVSSSSRYSGCTVIEGFLEIAISNSPGNTSLLYEHLSLIREVTRYVKIVRNPFLETLDFLKSLRHIRGDGLDSDKYALYVMENQNLETLWDFEQHVTLATDNKTINSVKNPVLLIDNGTFFFQQNEQLCYSKIKRLLDLTTFKGTLLGKNGSMYKISNATHDKFDVSTSTNGQNGNCYNNSLFFSMIPGFTLFPSYNFSAFKTNDERVIISYVLYYQPVGAEEVATYYKSRRCESDQRWVTYEIKKNHESQKKINNVTYYSSFITGMTPFTRYALYVQTFTTEAIGLNGARSEIIYYNTAAAKPGKPRRTVVRPVYSDGNTALQVSWEEPDAHNGIIERYNIYYRMKPWKTEQIYRKDFCQQTPDMYASDKDITTPANVLTTTPPADKGKCNCKNGEQLTTAQKKTKEQHDSELRYNFENYLQNNQFIKNPRKTSSDTYVRNKRDAVDQLPPDLAVELGNHSLTSISLADSPKSIITSTMSTTTTAKPVIAKPEILVASMVSVLANKTSALLFDLEPNMEYSIEVMACHAYNKTQNITRCSKRAVSTAITKPDPMRDVIDSSTLHVEKISHEDEPALKFSWEPPKKTNGPILSYTIVFSVVNNTNKSVLPDDKPKDNADEVTSVCINAFKFEKENNSHIFASKHLKEGFLYEFKVRMRTVGTKIGNFTTPVRLQYGEPYELNPAIHDNIIVGVSVSSVLVVACVILALIYCYRLRRKKPLPLATLHNSYNIDYMDTENIYIPDEWELERSKVKIGISLGQGSFGMVYEGEAKDMYNTDKKLRKVAIKTVNDSATIQDRISFLNEASRMKAFKCHHIVQLLGVVSQGQPVLVIMELMALGDLKNYLRMHRPDEPDNDGRRPPTLREILQMAAEIADGMAYLSDRKFVHRDLAARNCMVAHDMTVKIGDFGMTRDIYDSDYYRKGGKGMLPVRWMAPESLKDGLYTSKSDVWSYGVVLWEMATLAAQPYQGFSNEEVLKFVIDSRVMEMPDGCPIRLYDMMIACWQYYPRYRPTFVQLMSMLQGDVKKSFFNVSWFYSQRDDEPSDDESDSLNPSESQPLHPASIHSLSDHHLEADHALDEDTDIRCHDVKDLVCDIPPPVPKRFKSRSLTSSTDGFDMRRSEPMLNGHHTTTASESDGNSDEESLRSDSLPSLPNGVITQENFYSQTPCKPPSSIVSVGQGPPSYNTATILDQPIIHNDPSIWSSENASKTNSCNGSANGSANGHIHYGTNTLTSAC